VRIVPFPGIGCQDTITTTVQSPENLALNIVPSLTSCKFQSFDLTAPAVTAGSDTSFTYTYYTDSLTTQFVTDPTNVTDSGTYYIKATSPAGCNYVKPVTVSFLLTPVLKINEPPAVCYPTTVDITARSVTAGSVLRNLAHPITYWTDAKATIPLTNPNKITKSGTYYIKAENTIGCSDTEPVTVLINDLPVLVTNTISGCQTANITVAAATEGSSYGTTLTYWADSKATIPLTSPNAITQTGTYYIQATNTNGCSVIAPITVNVYQYPQVTVTDPPAVVFPQTVDITTTFVRQTGTAYYIYIDSLCTQLLGNPTEITNHGTYYIKAVNGNDCALVLPVKVTINAPPPVDFGVNTFTPNGDSRNDVFRIKLPDAVKLYHFRIYGSWGGLLFETTSSLDGWDGTSNGKKMPVGTYYWIFDGYDTYLKKPIKQSGSVTIVR
jgi:gliding motility-associated-like protein